MLCVVARPLSGPQDAVVGGEFSFHSQLPDGEPDERIEPIREQRASPKQLSQNVAASNVSQFVKQNAVPLSRTPSSPIAGNDQAWIENADYRRYARFIRLQRDNRPLDYDCSSCGIY